MSFSPMHARSPSRGGPSPRVDDDRTNVNTIFVGNLAPDSDERSLRDFFGKYGYITQVKVGANVLSLTCFADDSLKRWREEGMILVVLLNAAMTMVYADAHRWLWIRRQGSQEGLASLPLKTRGTLRMQFQKLEEARYCICLVRCIHVSV